MRQHKSARQKRNRCLKLLFFLLIIVAINMGGDWLVQQIDFQRYPRHEPMLHILLLSLLALYILLMALPFMPGIEIGLALMMVLGGKGVVLVYACTLLALSISFWIGRVVPCRILYSALNWLHFDQASTLIKQIEPLNPQQRLEIIHRRAPSRIVPFLLHHRYLTIAALLNLPGNALIGGGGGIGLIVGMSKMIPFYRYLPLLAIAIAPVPLIIFLQSA